MKVVIHTHKKLHMDHHRSLFDVSNLKSGFKALFVKRDHNMRRYIILMIICFEMEMFINVGEWSSTYLYLRRQLVFFGPV